MSEAVAIKPYSSCHCSGGWIGHCYLILIIKFKVHAMISILIGAYYNWTVVSGMPLNEIVDGG